MHATYGARTLPYRRNDQAGEQQQDLKVALIGPGGERLSRIAAVINDRGRAAARSGLGAVMGSKNLKAVACAGAMRPGVFDKPKLQALMKVMLKEVKEKPSGMYYSLSTTGTPGAMVMHMSEHDVPIKNWGREPRGGFSWSPVELGKLGRHGKIRKEEICVHRVPPGMRFAPRHGARRVQRNGRP